MKVSLAIVLSVLLAGGVVAANQLSAQTTTTPSTTPTTTAAPAPTALATVQNVVEITRAVPSGTAAVDAFMVPEGVVLVVTDVIVTNTGTAAVCGGGVNRAGGVATITAPQSPTSVTSTGTPTVTTTTPTTSTSPTTTSITTSATLPGAAPTSTAVTPAMTATSTGTLTQTDSTVTGPLCVPAQTTTTLPLTTGIEFASGEVVQLLNSPAATPTAGTNAPAAAPTGSLAFHLRGLLITGT